MLQPGTLIAGRYEIQSPLASGGNGLVFAALDRTTEKRVAVKVLGAHVLHERAAREKLRLEAIVAGRVESDHIVQVWDAGVDVHMGIPYLVMELLKGRDLQAHVEENGPLGTSDAVEYLRQVAKGLDKAHGWVDPEGRLVPIVHRDLKPENLFLTYREDGSPLLKILDFGLAKVLSASATLSSEIRGTPLYMAPEQLTQAPVTPATDVWALGLITFFLLTGECYWLSSRNQNVLLPTVIKEVTDGATAIASQRAQQLGASVVLSDAFDSWFAQCVNMDPRARFRSAGLAVQALSMALDQPLLSSPRASSAQLDFTAPGHSDSIAAVAPKRSNTRRWLIAAGVAASVVGLGLGLLGHGTRSRAASTPLTEPNAAPSDSHREAPRAPAVGSSSQPSEPLAASAPVPQRPEEMIPDPQRVERAADAKSSAPAVTRLKSNRVASSALERTTRSSETAAPAASATTASSVHPAPAVPSPARPRLDPTDHR